MSEYSNLLEQTADRLFRDLTEGGTVERLSSSEQMRGWEKIEELGIANIFLPEEEAGMDGSWEDAAIIFRLSGYYALNLPVGETAIARKIARQYGVRLPASPAALGRSDDGVVRRGSASGAPLFRGTVTSHSEVMDGSLMLASVPSGAQADFAVLDPRQASHGIQAASVAGETRNTYRFDDAECILLEGPGDGPEMLDSYGAILRACQSAGALAACLEKCSQYVQERKQFGRPLRKFQAIQHQLALLAEESAAVYSASSAAAIALDKGREASFEIACAKLRSNQATGPATSIAHQVHGAIGFTREYSLHLYTQRLWAWRSEFGNDRHWAQFLGRHVLGDDGPSAWALITARGDQ